MEYHHDPELPLILSKLDRKYGFWRMAGSDEDAWNFCYFLPLLNPVDSIDDIKLVVPNSPQMDWCESTPFFCSITETDRDVIKKLINIGDPLPPHTFENIMLKKIYQHSDELSSSTPYVMLIEVSVDNSIDATNNHNSDQLTHVSRCLIHVIHSIFPPP